MPVHITRDPDFPAEVADLLQAFNQCARDHDTRTVLLAAANMLVAAVNMQAKAARGDREEALRLAREIAATLHMAVAEQWDRSPLATDVKVSHGH